MSRWARRFLYLLLHVVVRPERSWRVHMDSPRRRLLIDGHTFDAGPQGTTTFLAGVLNALPAAAAQSGRAPPEVWIATREKANASRYVDVPFTHVTMRGNFLQRNIRSLPKISRAIEADLVVSQYVRPLSVHGRSLCVIHDVLFLDFPQLFGLSYRLIRKALFGWSARHSDVVATVSRYSQDRLAHWFRLQPDAIAVVQNGVTMQPLSERRAEASEPYRILYVSRLEERKRQLWCIRAVADLKRKGIDVRLDLVGSDSGTYSEQVKEAVNSAQGDNFAVHLHQGLSSGALDELFAHADLLLFPSACEGFGIPVIEAAARGIPCVVADNTALSELKPWFVGRSFAHDGYDAMLEAVEDALSHLPALRIEAQERAPAVGEAFSWQKAAEAFLDSMDRAA